MIASIYLGTAVPELTDSQIKDILVNLDTSSNRVMLAALLYGKQI